MEEIKNWWGVFGLFDCVTVVLSSLERRCHRQGSLAALTNPAISFPFRVSGKRCSVAHTDSARIKMLCMSPSPKTYAFSLDLFNNASSFFIPWLSAWFFLWSVFFCLAFLSRCVGRFGYSKCFHRASINIHYFHHPCVLKLFEIAFHCGVALGSQPAVFGIYSSCVAIGNCTGNLCIISALLMLCLWRPLKSTALWNKKPRFLSLLSFFSNSPLFKKTPPSVSHYIFFILIW